MLLCYIACVFIGVPLEADLGKRIQVHIVYVGGDRDETRNWTKQYMAGYPISDHDGQAGEFWKAI